MRIRSPESLKKWHEDLRRKRTRARKKIRELRAEFIAATDQMIVASVRRDLAITGSVSAETSAELLAQIAEENELISDATKILKSLQRLPGDFNAKRKNS